MGIMLLGCWELFASAGFAAGYFFDIKWLLIIGGLLIVLDDIREIASGILDPWVPLALAVVLALVFSPWYAGVFWASAVFKLLNVPAYRRNMFTPRRKLAPVR